MHRFFSILTQTSELTHKVEFQQYNFCQSPVKLRTTFSARSFGNGKKMNKLIPAHSFKAFGNNVHN